MPAGRSSASACRHLVARREHRGGGCYNKFMQTTASESDLRGGQQTSLEKPRATKSAKRRQARTVVIIGSIGAVLLLGLLGLAIYALLQPPTPTDRIRDIFIIVVALETLVVGVALIVLLVQLASLINLVQNELEPILESTRETINSLRGTTEFLGESVVEPVIKVNSYLASVRRVLELIGIGRR
jgi:amino acid permease